MGITASEVKQLRDKTGCGMMECKKALVESNGDIEGAIEYLRKAGIAKAQKRAGRSATQGKWGVASNGNTFVLVEALCETDFVAKTDVFVEFVKNAANKALTYTEDGDISARLIADMDGDLKALIGKVGENMQIRRAIRWVAAEGNRIGYYIHTSQPFAAMVEVSGPCDDVLLNSICLHVTASNPAYITSKDVPKEVIAKEREIIMALPELQGKPEKMLNGIIMGKLGKLYKESCLMDMPWIDDEKTCLSKVAPAVSVVRFVRWLVGEDTAAK